MINHAPILENKDTMNNLFDFIKLTKIIFCCRKHILSVNLSRKNRYDCGLFNVFKLRISKINSNWSATEKVGDCLVEWRFVFSMNDEIQMHFAFIGKRGIDNIRQ